MNRHYHHVDINSMQQFPIIFRVTERSLSLKSISIIKHEHLLIGGKTLACTWIWVLILINLFHQTTLSTATVLVLISVA